MSASSKRNRGSAAKPRRRVDVESRVATLGTEQADERREHRAAAAADLEDLIAGPHELELPEERLHVPRRALEAADWTRVPAQPERREVAAAAQPPDQPSRLRTP